MTSEKDRQGLAAPASCILGGAGDREISRKEKGDALLVAPSVAINGRLDGGDGNATDGMGLMPRGRRKRCRVDLKFYFSFQTGNQDRTGPFLN